jgi:hypothetical protein
MLPQAIAGHAMPAARMAATFGLPDDSGRGPVARQGGRLPGNAGIFPSAPFDAGTDFAEAVRHCSAAGCAEFLTFDRELERQSRKLALKPPARHP